MPFSGILLLLAALGTLAYAVGLLASGPLRWRRERRARAVATARPIQDVAADVRRLGVRFHGLDPHASFTKVQAVCAAYDRALGECCTALGMSHLLGVLPDGPEHDAERRRVEDALAHSGVRLPHAA